MKVSDNPLEATRALSATAALLGVYLSSMSNRLMDVDPEWTLNFWATVKHGEARVTTMGRCLEVMRAWEETDLFDE